MPNTITTRMVIGEARGEEELHMIVRALGDLVQSEAYSDRLAYRILIEDGGMMVVFETDWRDRDAMIRHHATRSYRQFVAICQPYLIGDFVVKLFRREAAAT